MFSPDSALFWLRFFLLVHVLVFFLVFVMRLLASCLRSSGPCRRRITSSTPATGRRVFHRREEGSNDSATVDFDSDLECVSCSCGWIGVPCGVCPWCSMALTSDLNGDCGRDRSES